MSWKSLVCAGLLCALAIPASAQPTVTVDLVRNGSGFADLDDATGNWQWLVTIEGDGAGALAAELAFRLTEGDLEAVVEPNSGGGNDWDHENPGTDPNGAYGDFGWLASFYNEFGDPEGVESDLTADEVYASLGSIDFGSQTESEYLIIQTTKPSTAGDLTTSIDWGGAYSGTGRVAQDSGGGVYVNNDGYSGSLTKTALAGDANMNGDVTVADYNLLLAGLPDSNNPTTWEQGDFNGNGDTTVADYNILLAHLPDTPITPPGGGGGAVGAAVPEPGTAFLLLFAGPVLLIGRKRR